jgi:diketogulonate reductase-like aldo/keto reductase
MTKTLVAFFSRADENYFGGAMRYVKVGNTEIVVGIINNLIEADTFKIEMKEPYSPVYMICIEEAKRGIARSLRKLNLDYIDLYLIHQPYGDVEGAWKAMEEAKAEGKIHSIGVSNMSVALWNKFVPHFNIKPAVNQVEFNPLFQQKEIRALMKETDTKLEAWYPLGHGDASLLSHEIITILANKYGKNPGQIILRFEVQDGVITLPKSTNKERIKTNLDIFDFTLTNEEMEAIRQMDTGKGSHNPDAPGVEERLRSAFIIED